MKRRQRVNRAGGSCTDYPSFASTQWPNVRATHSKGGLLGLPATKRWVGMRGMDFSRRDRLIENCVFLDLIDHLLQIGMDVVGRESSRMGCP